MTQLRRQKDSISNYFDTLLDGIGHRGSSFMDVDAFTHDGATKRWLVQEFKHEGETLDKAQNWMLRDLATLPKWFTVWVVVKRNDGRIGFAEYCPGRELVAIVIDVEEYQDRFRAWWANSAWLSRVPPPPVPIRSQLPPEAPHEFAAPAGPPLAVPLVDTDYNW